MSEIVNCKLCGKALLHVNDIGRGGLCASCTARLSRQYMTVLSDDEWDAAIQSERAPKEDIREFMIEFRRTLLKMTDWIEKRYVTKAR